MLPKDPNDDNDIIMEIRGAAGGDEASLFAGDLFRMYEKYAERQGWKTSIIDSEPTEVGGYKRVAIMITGKKFILSLNMKTALTVYREFRQPNRKGVFIPQPQLLRLCQNISRLTSI